MNYEEVVIRREVDKETALVLTEIGGPYAAIIAPQRRSDGTPINQIQRMPDQQPGSIVEAGMRKVKLSTDPNGAGIRVIAAHDRIAIGIRAPEPMPTDDQVGGSRARWMLAEAFLKESGDV